MGCTTKRREAARAIRLTGCGLPDTPPIFGDLNVRITSNHTRIPFKI